jgi:MFS family permease
VLVDRFDWLGLGLLATSSTALLLAISAASGLELGGVVVAGLFVVAVAVGVGLAWRLGRAAQPLVDPALLRTRRTALGLFGALGGYLVLFGPLVLVPAVLTAGGTSLAVAGLVLTALPAGFAVAAVAGDRVLPHGWSDRRRALTGSAVSCCALALMLVTPSRVVLLVPLLAVLGTGLGSFAPANNSLIMSGIRAGAEGTGGGLVNMARALGTALGVALVTLTLHQRGGTRVGLAATGVLGLVAVVVFLVTCASD